jgi:hypothetical protein
MYWKVSFDSKLNSKKLLFLCEKKYYHHVSLCVKIIMFICINVAKICVVSYYRNL